MDIIFDIFAAICAAEDLRHRSVHAAVFTAFAAAALILWLSDPGGSEGQDLLFMVSGMMPGLLMLFLSAFSKGFGTGDALFFLVGGMYLGMSGVLTLFATSVFFCGIYGLLWHISVRLNEHNDRVLASSLPFLTFVGAARLFMRASELLAQGVIF